MYPLRFEPIYQYRALGGGCEDPRITFVEQLKPNMITSPGRSLLRGPGMVFSNEHPLVVRRKQE